MTNEKVTRASEKLLSKLQETHAALERALEAPLEVLDLLVTAVSKGEEPTETWELLHQAAERDGKIQELGFAYESMAADKRVRLLTADQQAYIYLWAVHFFGGQFGDAEGALTYGQRALAVDPAHQPTFEALEYFLADSPAIERLAPLYLKAAQHETDPTRRLGLLTRATELVSGRPADDDLARAAYEQLLAENPRDLSAREALAARHLQMHQPQEAVRLFEFALEVTPPLDPAQQRDVRERLIDMYQSTLKQPERALPHVEGLLQVEPNHPAALALAESLREHRSVGLRATAALSDAYSAAGHTERAIEMLNIELSRVRGPRRVEVGRRLAIYRQDLLNDPVGALELLGPVVAGDPGNDEMRQRFVTLSLALDQTQQAARLLSRALSTSRDPNVRARVGVDVGEVFLKTGDLKRAEAAFLQVLDTQQDPPSMLKAARRLAEQESPDPAQRARVLALLVEHETEKERRQAAARRLAKLCETEIQDDRLAIAAYRALLGSPYSDEALANLEALYQRHSSPEGMAEVLTFRAERTKDPVEARELAFRAAELRSEHGTDYAGALEAWRQLVEKYGPTREAYQRIIPLLEKLEDYEGLAEALEQSAKLQPADEASHTLARLGQLRIEFLGDARSAVSAFHDALQADPENRASRQALERLVQVAGLELEAARVLEPLYRKEQNAPGLVTLLKARAAVASNASERLAALSEAVVLAHEVLADVALAFDLAGRALLVAAEQEPSSLAEWLTRAQALGSATGDTTRLAEVLQRAFGKGLVTSPEQLALARATAEALAQAGRIEDSVAVYRKALEFQRSPDLVERVDQLLVQLGNPGERLELYESALTNESDPLRRAALHKALAELHRRELGAPDRAIEHWRAALEQAPGDTGARMSLVDLLTESGELEAAYAELEHGLSLGPGSERQPTLERLAELAARSGALAKSLEHYREILKSDNVNDALLERIQGVAEQFGDGATVQSVIERRIKSTTGPSQRVALFERAGDNALERLGDPKTAIEQFVAAAKLCVSELADDSRAVRLYERILALDPHSRLTAERLVELYSRGNLWDKLAVPFQILRRQLDAGELTQLLLSLEERAVTAGAAGVFVELADGVLGNAEPEAQARPIALAKARVLSSDPARADEAAELYKELVESAQPNSTTELDAFEQFLATSPAGTTTSAHQRWLFEVRVTRAADPVPVLLEWAEVEERQLGDADRALQLYQRVVALAPRRVEALTELARLQSERGQGEDALASLRALAEELDGDAKAKVELRIAKLLLDPLQRPVEALDAAEATLRRSPGDPDALDLALRALHFPESRTRAAQHLENAAEFFADPAERARVLETLLSLSEDNPELREARGRWLKGLLAIKSDDPHGSLEVALRAAQADPADDELWSAAERFARQLDLPDPVALAYSRAISQPLPPELAETLGRRVVEFHEEWFEDNQRVVELLRRVLELSPSATWAFDRLKLEFNATAKWQDLFSLYDKALEHAKDDAARTELLREVSMAAKDFAGDAEKAIYYLEKLHALNPKDDRVEASLERLYERNNHYRPLIDLLSARLAAANGADDLALRERMARLWMELDEPLAALELVQHILEKGHAERVVDLLESLVALPAARDSMTPAPPEEQERRSKKRKQRVITVRERASQHLKTYYQETGSIPDVVRMLEVAVETAQNDEQRVKRLKQIIKVRLNELEDSAGAFENVSQLVTLEPHEEQFRKLLHQLAERLGSHDRQAELLVSVGDAARDAKLKVVLWSEAAHVRKEQLFDAPKSIELFQRVLELAHVDERAALAAARQLNPMLEEAQRFAERCSVLERLADLETDTEARRAAQSAAARVAFQELGDPARSIRNWQARLATDQEDLEALDGLVLAYTAAEAWDELVQTLARRSELQTEPALKRADLVSVARVHVDRRGDIPSAIDTWRTVYQMLPEDGEAFDALISLLTHEERWIELAALLDERAGREESEERKAALNRQLGEVHKSKTGDARAALAAFVKARDWASAMEVARTDQADPSLSQEVCRSLLDQAVGIWLAAPDTGEAACAAAQFAIAELSQRLLASKSYAEVVDLLLEGAELPFEDSYSRQLRRQAAFLCADELNDAPRAIVVFKGLFAEDPQDAVAASSVARLATLFEAAEQYDDLVSLWEQQAACHENARDLVKAAELWTLAGELSEQRLLDVERAMADHRRAAALRGEPSLEALARLHAARGEPLDAAHVLEWLCSQSTPDQLAARALVMAEQYLKAGRPKVARARLERAMQVATDPAPLRKRLAELYREAKLFTPLAALLALEATFAPDLNSRLGLLREAARLHVIERQDPNSAVPLLAQAVELDPEDTELRLSLADAYRRASRYDEAILTLRTQIERYGARRPKERALVHYRLGQVCIAAARRAEALAELDAANKIDPAHAGVSQALARLAFEEGDLDRAERMYRALLFVLGTADSDDAPSRATALLDLSEIAEKKGDAVRAEEFIESAFESALEHEHEARALERALKERGRVGLLARALETRLKENLPPAEAARAMGTLVQLASSGHVKELDQRALKRQAESVLKGLEKERTSDASAWTALSMVFDHLGDRQKEALILEQQVASWAEAGEQPDSAEPYYRLAAARLKSGGAESDAVDLLEQALAIDNDVNRVESLLREALSAGTTDARTIRLFERVARTAGNKRSLLEALTMAAALPDAGIKVLREGVTLAEQLGAEPLKQAILERGAARDEGSLEPQDHAWVLMELAQVRELAGDIASAFDLRETAAERLPLEEGRALLLAVAQTARAQGALARAARVLERLREREPQDREVWEPLLAVYHELEDSERIVALLQETIPLVDSALDRSKLRLEQANVVLNAGDEDRAIQILRDTLEEDPRHLEAAETLTTLLKRTGRTTELAELLRVQLDAAKDRQKVDSIVAASMQLGQLLETKEHHRDASDVYRAVLDWDHGNRDALRGVVRMAELTGDAYAIADAIEALLRVETAEHSMPLVKRLIQLREETNDPEGVERALELAVHANPLDVDQRDALVARYRKRGEPERAAELLARALELAPDDWDLMRQVLEAFRESGELARALATIDRLIQAAPESVDLLRQRAGIRNEINDLDGALEDLERAYQLDPSDSEELLAALQRRLELRPDDQTTVLQLVEVLLSARQVEEARYRLREFVKTQPSDKATLIKLVELDRSAEDWDATTDSLKRLIALERGEGLVPLAFELARVAEAAGRPGDARSALERALSIEPTNRQLSELLRRMYEAVGAHRELAELLLHDASQSQDDETRLQALLKAAGFLLEEDDEAERAIEVLEQARQLAPQDLDVATLLARAYAGLGRQQEALMILEDAANNQRGRRQRGLVGVYVEMANILQEAEAAAEALQALIKAHELDLKNPHLAMRLGRLALALGEDQQALRAFRTVTIMKPNEEVTSEEIARMKGDAHYHLALLAERQGDPRKAKILCSKALSEDPSHQGATQLLDQLSQS